jgi:hypothetical protein
MTPARLTVWLFGLGLVPLLAGIGYEIIDASDSFALSAIPLLVLAFDFALILLLLTDAALAKSYRRLRVSRQRHASLSVGVQNEVPLTSLVRRRGAAALRVRP